MRKICTVTVIALTLLGYESKAEEIPSERLKEVLQIGDLIYDPEGFSISSIYLGEGEGARTGHIAIYVGDIVRGGVQWEDQVVEATIIGGVYHIGLTSWDSPDINTIEVLRPKVSQDIKEKAVEFAIDQIGKRYSINFFSKNASRVNNEWYCSELLWAAYYQNGEGVDLVDVNNDDFVSSLVPASPEDIRNDDDIDVILSFNVLERVDRVYNITQQTSFPTLREAVADAHQGDVIELTEGAYLDTVTVDTAGITIRARTFDQNGKIAKTTLKAVKNYWETFDQFTPTEDKPSALVIKSPNVTVQGLTIMGTVGDINRLGDNIPRQAVSADRDADNLTVKDCIFFANTVGLGINYSARVTVEGNTFAHNTYGLGFIQSYGTEIKRNVFRNSKKRAVMGSDDLTALKAMFLGIHPIDKDRIVTRNTPSVSQNPVTYAYLNMFKENNEPPLVEYENSSFRWFSPDVLAYEYAGQSHRSRLGNLWDDHDSFDSDGNGISDDPYREDMYPLMSNPSFYTISQQTSIGEWLLF